MVNHRCKFLFLIHFLRLFSCCSLLAVDMSSAIDGTNLLQGVPLKGTITISHNQNEAIDNQSFLIGKDPLKIEKIKDVKISSSNPLILTIYKFQIDPQMAGHYVLPVITATVAGNRVSSLPVTYEIAGGTQDSAPLVGSDTSIENAFLRLEALIDGPTSLYPSQRTRFVYRYFFNASIALTVEQLPLLTAEGLVKIGEKDVRDVQDGDLTAREISQVVEASAAGTFTFGPSVIEGYAYRADSEGNIIEKSPLLKSEAPTLTLTVLPFPKQEKPPGFNGAIGNFTFTTGLKGDNSASVGEDLALILKIGGVKNSDSVPIPDLCCQPGFVGTFKVSDLPPLEATVGDVKTATVLLKPLSSALTEIPPVTFIFFNPDTNLYVSLESEPIPIVVHPVVESLDKNGIKSNLLAGQKEPTVAPLRFNEASMLTDSDLHDIPLGSRWVLLLLPLGIAFLAYQYYLHRNQSIGLKVQSSEALFRSAKNETRGSSHYFGQLLLSLKQRLVESGTIGSIETPIELWPSDERCQKVIVWMNQLEEFRFSGKESLDINRLEQSVENLFNQIPIPHKNDQKSILMRFGPSFIFAALFAWILLGPSLHFNDSRLMSAAESYRRAMAAPELYPKQTALLEALYQYESLSDEHHPEMGTGKLEEAISSVYAHLGRLPEALWHARNAEMLAPRDSGVLENIKEMEQVLFLENAFEKKSNRFLLALPQWHLLFACVVIMAILLSSYAIWSSSPFSSLLLKGSCLSVVLICLPLLYVHYFAPLYGSVLTSSDLRAGPSFRYPRVGEQPLPSGSILEVVAVSTDGLWLQVFTSKGETGYIPSSYIGL